MTGHVLAVICIRACKAYTGHPGPVRCVYAGAARTGRALLPTLFVCESRTRAPLTSSCARTCGGHVQAAP